MVDYTLYGVGIFSMQVLMIARTGCAGLFVKCDYFWLDMRRLITLGILFCAFSSAHREPPVELISQEQMVSILVDLEVAKAMARYYTDDEDTACWLFKKNALLIYQVYDIDLYAFQKSYQYYLASLETMKAIYEVVIERLEELDAQI